MKNYMDYATDPMKDNTVSLEEMMRQMFHPTEEEIQEHERRRKKAAMRIRQALKRNK